MNKYYVYILASKAYGTLYIGVTNNLAKRVQEHKTITTGFTYKYQVFNLVYVENYSQVIEAIAREKQLKTFRREKQLKTFRREWKIALINEYNPEWLDLLTLQIY